MNTLYDLLHQSKGNIKYLKLSECCNILDNRRKPISKSSRVSGHYPYYGANGIQDYVHDYIFDGSFILVGEDGSVITKSGKPIVTWATGKIWVNNHAHILSEKENINLRYLFHYLQTVDITSMVHGSIPKLTGKDLKSILIPIPALELQNEIVNILDVFKNMEAELEAELEARKKQFEYYRNSIFSDLNSYPKLYISDICKTICSGGTPNTQRQDFYCGTIPWLRTQEVDFKDITDTAIKISEEAFLESSTKWVEENSIIVAMYGATAGKCAVTKIRLTTNQACCNLTISPDIANYRYVYHWICLNYQNIKKMGRGSQSNINSGMLKNLLMPIPPLDIQNKIAKILDTFDSLCNDLAEGIPAEIEARRKQYEYYRDKLLSFKELEN